MATFVVTAPDGKEYEVDAPKGATQEQALAYFQSNWQAPKQPQERSWGDVALSAVSNIPSSAAEFGKSIAQTVTSPVETAKTLGKLGKGAIQHVLPESLVGSDEEAKQMASQVGQFYKNRYGTMEGFKEALATDPVGILADVATVGTGGGAAVSKVPGLAKVGQMVSTAGRAVDPLVMALRGTEKVASGVGKAAAKGLGMTTGVGDEPIKQAYLAGRAGGETGKSFTQNLRGEVPMQDVLDTAKSDLAAMGQQQKAAYRADMKSIKGDKSVLGFDDIDSAIANAEERTRFKGKIVKENAAKSVDEVKQIVNDWKNASETPYEYHTPEGFDALKQKVGDVLESIPYEQKNARAAVGEVYNSIKTTINKQAPKYAKVMKDYGDAAETIREIERALSLGQKSSADTAMRKLQSLMRNNVQTNYGNRLNLAKQLEQAGGQPIMPALAGQALSEWTPRGLQRTAAIPTAGGAYLMGEPALAGASLAASSPRLVGEAALKAGQLARGLRVVKGAANALPIPPNVLANYLYQAGVNTQGDQ